MMIDAYNLAPTESDIMLFKKNNHCESRSLWPYYGMKASLDPDGAKYGAIWQIKA
jgi:hypothetical protein